MSTINIKDTISKMLPHFLTGRLIGAWLNAIAHGAQLLIDRVDTIYNGAGEWSSLTNSPYSGIYYELAHGGQKNSMQAYLNAYIYGITRQSNHLIWVKDNTDNLEQLYIYDDISYSTAPATYGRYVFDDNQPDTDQMKVYAPPDYVDVAEGYNFVVSVPPGMSASDLAAVKNKVDSLKVAGVNYEIIERGA